MADIPFDRANGLAASPLVESQADAAREIVIPLFEEKLAVSKQIIPTSRVQVSRVTNTREQFVEELLHHEDIAVERVVVDQPVDTVPPIRDDGETIVVPIVEEVLRVERYLVLKEELRVRRVRRTEKYQEGVTLRKQEAVVTRLAIANPTVSPAGTQTDVTPTDQEESTSHEP